MAVGRFRVVGKRKRLQPWGFTRREYRMTAFLAGLRIHRQFVDGLCKTVFTLALSLGSLSFGKSLAAPLSARKFTTTRLPTLVRSGLILLSLGIYIATIPLYHYLPSSYRGQATAALLFSYPGTLTRYLLSTTLNPKFAHIPLGTLSSNLIGTALLGTFHVLQRLSTNPVSSKTCSLLQGLMDGYCGCLTTISTFAVEVAMLGKEKGARYALISWMGGQLVLLAILGPSYWGSGGRISVERTCHSPI